MAPETTVERRLTNEVKKRGGLCLKFISPGNSGVMDRIVVTPDGRVIFVETKRADGILSAMQDWQAKRFRKRSVDVRAVYSTDQVQEFVKEIFGEKEE
jgi:hypothetical protein